MKKRIATTPKKKPIGRIVKTDKGYIFVYDKPKEFKHMDVWWNKY